MIEPGATKANQQLRRAALVAGLIPLLIPAAALAQPMMGGMPGMGSGPTEVGVVSIEHQDVPYTSTLPGRVAASKTAEVRPQVGGILKSVDFLEGREVSAGDLLYQIESDSYQASLASAEATLKRAELAVSSAQSTVDRYEKLVGGGVSQTSLEDARISLLQAEADVAAAQATVTAAQINLDHTSITAPLSGVIGLSSVNQGALVTASQSTALATIRQLDPVYIDLVDSSANLLKLRKALKSGILSGNGRDGTVALLLEDGSEYEQIGSISQADLVVSETTGTFEVRATMPNPDRILMPGMFVRAIVEHGTENAFLVPQRAVTFNSNGNATVLVVSEDSTAETHVLETSRSYGNAWVVTGGLEDGDQIIVDGLQKISDGSEISPLPVEIDEDGVILQTISDDAPDGAPAAGGDEGNAQ